jgi:hypothetical protein
MRHLGSLLLLLLAIAGGGCNGSSSADREALTGPVESGPVETTGTTTSSLPPVPPPLTHRQFIHTLDQVCKVGNRLLDRMFADAPTTIYDTAESLDAYAKLLEKADAFGERWFYKKNHFLNFATW